MITEHRMAMGQVGRMEVLQNRTKPACVAAEAARWPSSTHTTPDDLAHPQTAISMYRSTARRSSARSRVESLVLHPPSWSVRVRGLRRRSGSLHHRTVLRMSRPSIHPSYSKTTKNSVCKSSVRDQPFTVETFERRNHQHPGLRGLAMRHEMSPRPPCQLRQ